jgi:hypothetical protein
MAISKEEMLSEIRKFIAAHGGEIPGERTFLKATGIKGSAWRGRYWVRWSDAVRDAGYGPKEMTQKIPEEDILEKLVALITKLGRFPVRDEINIHARAVPGLPIWNTIKKRYGGMPQTARALLEFCVKTGNTAVARLCEDRLKRESLGLIPPATLPGKSVVKTGFV